MTLRLVCSLLLMQLALSIPLSFATEIYEWRDDHGELHFSDTPHDGAKKINIEVPQAQASQAPTTSTNTDLNQNARAEGPVQIQYEVQIVNPKNEETIRNGTGNVTVNVSLKPRLQQGHKVSLYFDERAASAPQPVTVFELKNVPRGAHKLYATVVDNNNQLLSKSTTVTFFVFRNFIQPKP